MKYNCDYFRDRKKLKRERQALWHPWFAWKPVKLAHGDCRWFEVVYRRKERYYSSVWNHHRSYEDHENVKKLNDEIKRWMKVR